VKLVAEGSLEDVSFEMHLEEFIVWDERIEEVRESVADGRWYYAERMHDPVVPGQYLLFFNNVIICHCR